MATSDHQLLQAYARRGDEAAFTELVRRFAPLVHAAARRQLGDPQLAEDVTQAVFVRLAQKAASLGPEVIVAGWLLRAAHYAAADVRKTESRRRRRETEALSMQTSDHAPDPSAQEDLWDRIAPVLDEALARLRGADRDALVLRYWQGESLAQVGAALGLAEDAARKRVRRALDRLRAQLERTGIRPSPTALGAVLSTRLVPAPAPQDFVSRTANVILSPSSAARARADELAHTLGRRLWWSQWSPWIAAGTAAVMVTTATAPFAMERLGRAPVSLASAAQMDDYRPAGFPDSEVVRAFVAELQVRLKADDRQAIAGMARYPLIVNTPAGQHHVRSERELIERFDSIFPPGAVAIVLRSPNRGLFCNSEGVMVGDGTLWVAPDEAGLANPTPRIIALNLE